MTPKITEFRGEYRFLSNFYPNDNTGTTVEHWYQACKTTTDVDYWKIMTCKTPGDAKRMGQKITIRSDWEQIKVKKMKEFLRQKFFFNNKLGNKLLNTNDAILEEGNHWKDTFWGVCPPNSGNGQNMLGKLLMEIRSELRKSENVNTL